MMETDMANAPWLMGDDYSLADALLAAYVYRIDCVGLSSLWESRFPKVTDWWARVKAREGFKRATEPWLDAPALEKIRAAGREAFLSDDRFGAYVG